MASADEPNPKESMLAKLGQWAVLIAFASLAVVPLTMYGCAGERDRWHAASAFNLYEEGKTDEAIEALSEIAGRESADPRLQLQLAQLLYEHDRGAEGLEICDRLLKNEFVNEEVVRGVRVSCLQKVGRFEEALDEYKLLLSKDTRRTKFQFNNIAYFRALAGKDLDKAYAEIQKAINQQELDPIRMKSLDEVIVSGFHSDRALVVSLRTRSMLAAAMASRELDCRDLVFPLLDEFVESYEHELFGFEQKLTALVYEQIRIGFPMTPTRSTQVTSELRTKRFLAAHELVMLRTARALLLQDEERSLACDQDRARIKELGFDADLLAVQLPRGLDCINIFKDATMTLDTRGYVRYRAAVRTGDLLSAKRDLDVAVLVARVNQLSFESSMRNSTAEVIDVRLARRGAKKTFAVLMYHRMLVNEKLGNLAAAAEDAHAIRELGEEPSSQLF